MAEGAGAREWRAGAIARISLGLWPHFGLTSPRRHFFATHWKEGAHATSFSRSRVSLRMRRLVDTAERRRGRARDSAPGRCGEGRLCLRQRLQLSDDGGGPTKGARKLQENEIGRQEETLRDHQYLQG